MDDDIILMKKSDVIRLISAHHIRLDGALEGRILLRLSKVMRRKLTNSEHIFVACTFNAIRKEFD